MAGFPFTRTHPFKFTLYNQTLARAASEDLNWHGRCDVTSQEVMNSLVLFAMTESVVFKGPKVIRSEKQQKELWILEKSAVRHNPQEIP